MFPLLSKSKYDAFIPETVGQNKDGFLALRPLLATIVNAIKELASKVSETAPLIVSAITAQVANFGRVNTDELCTTRSDEDRGVRERRPARRNLDGNKCRRPATRRERSAGHCASVGSGDGADSSVPNIATSAASSTSDIVTPLSTAPESEAADSLDTHTEAAGSQPEPTLDGQPIIPGADDSRTTDAANDNSPAEQQAATE